MGNGLGRGITREHTGYLADALLPFREYKLGYGSTRGARFLGDDIVRVGQRCDLGQMGDHDDLMRLGEVPDYRGQRTCRGAADTGIDLVEDQGLGLVLGTHDDLERKEHARKLSTRGDTAQRARSEAFPATIEELIATGARKRPLFARKRTDVPNKLGSSHGKTLHLLRDRPAETRSQDSTLLRERMRCAIQSFFSTRKLLARLIDRMLAVTGKRQ